MGVILSRFRTKPTTRELLEEVEKDIEDLEEYKRSTETQQKHLVGVLTLYSIFVYIIGAVVFFIYYFPTNVKDRVMYSSPLLIFPILIWLLKMLLQWYFRLKIRNNDEQLIELKRKKRTLIELAMETETYKVVKELLEKFDPEFHKMTFERRAIAAPPKDFSHESDLRRRTSPNRGPPQVPLSNQSKLTVTPAGQGIIPSSIPIPSGNAPSPQPFPQFFPRNGQQWVRPPAPPLPRPLLPRDRTLIDRVVDYLVGDGPSNRYALICKQCKSHNGMALKEEFDYVAFRCCYCFNWNPARSQQPPAPRLPLPITSGKENSPTIKEPTSGSETSGGEDEAEIETVSDRETSRHSSGRSSPKNESEHIQSGVFVEEIASFPHIDEDDEND